MDYGHKQTDKSLKRLERELKREYRKAYEELKKRSDKYFATFKEEDAKMLSLVNKGGLSKDKYAEWRADKILTGKGYESLKEKLAMDLANVNAIAYSMINDNAKKAYALNFNYGIFEINKGKGIFTNFTLYDEKTVERLLKDNPKLLPKAKRKIPREMRWNKQKIQSSLIQGVLQGDSIDKLSKRLRDVTNMNLNSSIRNARTMTTGAENAGRIGAYSKAEQMGIKVSKKWMATTDGRTRHSHRLLDGEIVALNEEFSNGCQFPGDPDGLPEEVYNCRCTLVADLEGFDYETEDGSSYEEWAENLEDY